MNENVVLSQLRSIEFQAIEEGRLEVAGLIGAAIAELEGSFLIIDATEERRG